VDGLLTLLAACGQAEAAAAFEREFAAGPRRYAPLKEAVAEAVVAVATPLRERRETLRADRDRVLERVRASSAAAREIARATLAEVRDKVGLRPTP
jgi:tryptophanyl-tRNA synthetase